MTLTPTLRAAGLAGLACLLPVAVWLGGQVFAPASPGRTVALFESALRGLLVAQALAIALVGPRCVGSRVEGSGPGQALAGLALLLAPPLPLLLAIGLAGAAGSGVLAAGVLALTVEAAAIGIGVHVLDRAAPGQSERSVEALLQIGLATTVWSTRGVWLAWIGV